MFEVAGTVLAIGVILLATLIPLAVVAAIVGHNVALARRLGGPLEYDVPDAEVYWAGRRVAEENRQPDEIEKSKIQPDHTG